MSMTKAAVLTDLRHEFSNRVVLITGGASGIGAACATLLAARGAHVVVADINQERADSVAAGIRAGDGQASAMRIDVSNAASVESALATIDATHGGLDFAVNNAGITAELAPTGTFPIDTWHRVIDINLNGLFYCMRYELPLMQKRGRGAIVNLSSILGVAGMAGTAAYSASKHGVIGLTKACALDYANQGIRVNAVAPGYVDTPLLADDPDLRRRLASMHPMGRIAQPEEAAELIAFLLSDRASFITGSVHMADGGYSTR
jgi:NAD(P)-dependent dehydrogenase (short-subunit alcohol dehydrogenase family)